MTEGVIYEVKFMLNRSFSHAVFVFTEDTSGDDVVRLARLGWECSGLGGGSGSDATPADAPVASIQRLGSAYSA